MLYLGDSNNLLPLITKPTKLTHHTSTLSITFTQILIRVWVPVLRWLMSLTIYQCFVCLIDIYQGIREHSIFLIIATLTWTNILEM